MRLSFNQLVPGDMIVSRELPLSDHVWLVTSVVRHSGVSDYWQATCVTSCGELCTLTRRVGDDSGRFQYEYPRKGTLELRFPITFEVIRDDG